MEILLVTSRRAVSPEVLQSRRPLAMALFLMQKWEQMQETGSQIGQVGSMKNTIIDIFSHSAYKSILATGDLLVAEQGLLGGQSTWRLIEVYIDLM
eukprot:s1422_g20.t1